MQSTIANRKVYKVLLVDDHPIIRHGIQELIDSESDLKVCAQASNGSEAFAAIEEHYPDLAVVDISLGSESGLELIKDIKSRYEEIIVLVVSIHDESLYAERCLRAGAMGYLNKQAAVEHIVEAIRRVLKGKIFLLPHAADRLIEQAVTGRESGHLVPQDRLSDREIEVYRMLGEGMGTKEIAGKLHLSMKTIETYREHIKNKLNLKNSNEMVKHAVEWVMSQK